MVILFLAFLSLAWQILWSFLMGLVFFIVSSNFFKSKLERQIPHMEPAHPQLGKQQIWNFCILSTVQWVSGEMLAKLLILIRCYHQMVFAFASSDMTRTFHRKSLVHLLFLRKILFKQIVISFCHSSSFPSGFVNFIGVPKYWLSSRYKIIKWYF